MLLEPEEKAILQENEVPDLGKISTVKFFPNQVPFILKIYINT